MQSQTPKINKKVVNKDKNSVSTATAIQNMTQDIHAYQNSNSKTNNLPKYSLNWSQSGVRGLEGTLSSSNVKLTPVDKKTILKLTTPSKTPILQPVSPSKINIHSNSTIVNPTINHKNTTQQTQQKNNLLLPSNNNFIVQVLKKTNGILGSMDAKLGFINQKLNELEQNKKETDDILKSMHVRLNSMDKNIKTLSEYQKQKQTSPCEMPKCIPFNSVMDIKNLDKADEKSISDLVSYFEFIKGTTPRSSATNFIGVSFPKDSDIVKNVYCTTTDYSKTDDKVNLRQTKFIEVCMRAMINGKSLNPKPTCQEVYDSIYAALHAKKEALRRKAINETGPKAAKRLKKADDNVEKFIEEKENLQNAKKFNDFFGNDEKGDEGGEKGEEEEEDYSDENLIYNINGQDLNINNMKFLNDGDEDGDENGSETPYSEKDTYFEQSQCY